MPSGIKGFVFAALIAAIVSSLAAIINSASTIFSIDLYKVYFNPSAPEEKLVKDRKDLKHYNDDICSIDSFNASGIEQVFQFIQEYTGLVSPGITAMFILGHLLEENNSQGGMDCGTDNTACPAITEMDLSFDAFPR